MRDGMTLQPASPLSRKYFAPQNISRKFFNYKDNGATAPLFYSGFGVYYPPCSRKQKSDTEKPRSAHCSAVFPFPQNRLSQAFRDFQANFRRKKQSYAAYPAIAVPAFFKVGNAPSTKFHALSSQPSVEVWNETDCKVVRSSSVPKVLLAVE